MTMATALADVLKWTHHSFAGDLVGFLSGANALPQRELTARQQEVAANNPGLDANAFNAAVFNDAVASGDLDNASAVVAALRRRYDTLIADAQSAEHDGDLASSLRLAEAAHNHVPDGKALSLVRDADGNIAVAVRDAGDGDETAFILTPAQYHEYLIGLGTSYDHVAIDGITKSLHTASNVAPDGGLMQ
jgi:hypothetical protein